MVTRFFHWSFMAGKTYQGKTCAYCGAQQASTSGDHVVARRFFMPEQRANLPQVPACGTCNGEKSQLEHYLMSVLPFGARHPDANTNLTGQVAARLAKNAPLVAALRQGRRTLLRSINGGPWQTQTMLPLDSRRILALYAWIARGLAHHHWKVILSHPGNAVQAVYLAPERVAVVDAQLEGNPSLVQADLGNGTFIYAGAQAPDNDMVTLWRMSIYGAEVAENIQAARRASVVYAFSAPSDSRHSSLLHEIFGVTQHVAAAE
jgi:hypothetical protein